MNTLSILSISFKYLSTLKWKVTLTVRGKIHIRVNTYLFRIAGNDDFEEVKIDFWTMDEDTVHTIQDSTLSPKEREAAARHLVSAIFDLMEVQNDFEIDIFQ